MAVWPSREEGETLSSRACRAQVSPHSPLSKLVAPRSPAEILREKLTANFFLYLNSVYCLFQEFHSNKITLMFSWSIYPSSREKKSSRKEFSGRAKSSTKRSLTQFVSK